MVTYEWKNNSGKNNSFAALAHPQVFQNGQAWTPPSILTSRPDMT